MYFAVDPDEWETVAVFHDYGTDTRGNPVGSASWSLRRRAPEDVARIKAERRAEHEASILTAADAIRARRPPVTQEARGVEGKGQSRDRLRWIVREWVGSDPLPMGSLSNREVDLLLDRLAEAGILSPARDV